MHPNEQALEKFYSAFARLDAKAPRTASANLHTCLARRKQGGH